MPVIAPPPNRTPSIATGPAAVGPLDLADVTPVRMTVDGVRELLRLGFLQDDSSQELIDGVLVYRDRGRGIGMPASAEHVSCVRRLRKLIEAALPGDRFVVAQESDTAVNEVNLPQPDVAVLVGTEDDFLTRYPTAAEVALVAEVSSSSLRTDRGSKSRLYAAAGIPAYLILDIDGRSAELRTDPDAGKKEFASRALFTEPDEVRVPVAGFGDVSLSIAAVLPPMS